MIKQKLKRLLASTAMGIVALAMPFGLVGCEEESDPIKTDAEAYVMLKGFVEDFNVLNKDKSHQTYVSLGKTTKSNYNFLDSSLSENTITYLQSNMNMIDSIDTYEGTIQNYLNITNNTGYRLEQNNYYDLIGVSEKDSDLDITRKTGLNYIRYRNKDKHYNDQYNNGPNSTFSKFQVDKDYAKSTYTYNEQDFALDSEAVYNFWNTLLEFETYDSYIANKYVIAGNIIGGVADTEIDGDQLTIDFDIDYINNHYILKVQVTGDTIVANEDTYSKTTINNLFANVEITFNADGVLKISSIMNASQNTEVSSLMFSTIESLNGNNELSEEDKVIVISTLNTHYLVNFDAKLEGAEYISNHLPIESYCENSSLNVSTPIKITLMDGNLILIDEVYVYSYTEVNAKNLSLLVPEKIGHTFVGFFYNGYPYPKNSILFFSENTTLILNYERNSYTINFHSNGGTLMGEQVSALFGTIITISQEPLRDKFEFGGWYLNPECEGDCYNIGDDLIVPANDMHLYAKWIPISE